MHTCLPLYLAWHALVYFLLHKTPRLCEVVKYAWDLHFVCAWEMVRVVYSSVLCYQVDFSIMAPPEDQDLLMIETSLHLKDSADRYYICNFVARSTQRWCHVLFNDVFAFDGVCTVRLVTSIGDWMKYHKEPPRYLPLSKLCCQPNSNTMCIGLASGLFNHSCLSN